MATQWNQGKMTLFQSVRLMWSSQSLLMFSLVKCKNSKDEDRYGWAMQCWRWELLISIKAPYRHFSELIWFDISYFGPHHLHMATTQQECWHYSPPSPRAAVLKLSDGCEHERIYQVNSNVSKTKINWMSECKFGWVSEQILCVANEWQWDN